VAAAGILMSSLKKKESLVSDKEKETTAPVKENDKIYNEIL
jgi:hypothetical protein